MRHWHSVLPGQVYQLVYENLVTRPEEEIRKLLQFCGLDFEPACLTPEKTERAIRTPSSEQVRQPMTDQRIAYWKHFESNLAGLQSTLSDEIAEFATLLR
jgi:hypothetical protein